LQNFKSIFKNAGIFLLLYEIDPVLNSNMISDLTEKNNWH